MLSYLELKFQVNWGSGRHQNTGQQRLYEFYYLLSFDLWTSYLVRILFLKGYGSLFWKSTNFTKIFNGLQHSFQVWQGFIPNDTNLVITWSRNPHAKTPIPGKPSKSGLIGVWHKDNLYPFNVICFAFTMTCLIIFEKIISLTNANSRLQTLRLRE